MVQEKRAIDILDEKVHLIDMLEKWVPSKTSLSV